TAEVQAVATHDAQCSLEKLIAAQDDSGSRLRCREESFHGVLSMFRRQRAEVDDKIRREPQLLVGVADSADPLARGPHVASNGKADASVTVAQQILRSFADPLVVVR